MDIVLHHYKCENPQSINIFKSDKHVSIVHDMLRSYGVNIEAVGDNFIYNFDNIKNNFLEMYSLVYRKIYIIVSNNIIEKIRDINHTIDLIVGNYSDLIMDDFEEYPDQRDDIHFRIGFNSNILFPIKIFDELSVLLTQKYDIEYIKTLKPITDHYGLSFSEYTMVFRFRDKYNRMVDIINSLYPNIVNNSI